MMSDMSESPVLVEVLRGPAVESRHRGTFAVVDAAGGVVASAGSIDAPVFPRSAVKPMQALPLIESGAADAFGLSDRELALACASHRAEAAHVAAVEAWLRACGLGVEALECGAHAPSNPAAAAELVRREEAPSAAHNNCSGKHTGFVCTAVHLGEDPRGYIGRGHAVQRRAAAAVSEMTGVDLDAVPCGCDGCGIPSYAIPLRGLARGMARMVDTAGLGRDRARAAERLMGAMAAEPFYVSGTGSFVTECMRAAGGAVRVKTGAEGVYAAALPGLGYGVALKIEDGASRASELAMATLLRGLGCFDAGQEEALGAFLAPVVRNVVGAPVGAMRATGALSVRR
jgi:L-asparaginase II